MSGTVSLRVLKRDCTAHSVEYDLVLNTIRPLMVLTDVWCSSGVLTPDGSLVQTGGFNDGERIVRVFDKSCGKCDWKEIPSGWLTGGGMLLIMCCPTVARL
ncbi:putative glyoxal oxidase, galactose oxidase/kelch, beta-propeller [Helianthus annuus]|uniref:Glyoxal oxidase, galactose oxidase/kelch, beta-propeller n=1 Tax=Helianthus annuus TaxID=4232 RepID=A0A251SMH9_HELAN|nr:putative glyoxal oxidase, galactose oxidase/kelch, beta-propeller [Helianthus annuus]KAJ0470882.1 putative glyoxal oxidase, galactose oxidase/kelch, beta-propeller [Helianthus annuus]KAJ0487513.1 putative glyoxal oxidase, galactose oxidase/kelch, beta-propeller [Helianthus annuus]KAJ0657955.1 putative glyoxal oxidase, galactose oxidase/kelch, beta-propeller [Helianthus annuus]KAJ0661637.1 putative glyoxal oxidase, galactose oxidase/kelch, beta-propeller [Helianthus annuus]